MTPRRIGNAHANSIVPVQIGAWQATSSWSRLKAELARPIFVSRLSSLRENSRSLKTIQFGAKCQDETLPSFLCWDRARVSGSTRATPAGDRERRQLGLATNSRGETPVKRAPKSAFPVMTLFVASLPWILSGRGVRELFERLSIAGGFRGTDDRVFTDHACFVTLRRPAAFQIGSCVPISTRLVMPS